jgi:signal transduction histidine kinase
MSANSLVQYGTQAIFVVVFVVVLRQAIRRPLRANVDIALLFGALALVIAQGLVTQAVDVSPSRLMTVASASLLMALPYLLLRLVDDFSKAPRLLMRGAEIGLLLAVLGLIVYSTPLPGLLTWLYVLYFLGLQVYAAVIFVREARRSGGVTQRRMQAVAAGSLFLGLTILAAGMVAVTPALEDLWSLLAQGFGLASGIGYFIGFAPPTILRRAWQEPELRAFLGRAARLPRLPDTTAIVRELNRGAAASLGAPNAGIGLWNPDLKCIEFSTEDGSTYGIAPGELIVGQAFAQQRAIYESQPARSDPDHAEVYRAANAAAVLAAPITAGEKRLGVLVVFAPHAPIFAEDDLVLCQLLADQAAVILESRALIDEAARVQAREEATRLKDDFLSAAAHDLKTPLTTLVAQAQFLDRQATRDPTAPADINGIRRVVRESQRLSTLVRELLDASRLERGTLLGPREPVDLVSMAEDICGRFSSDRHVCSVEPTSPIVGDWDPVRVSQVVENLVENAVKYSPDGGEVRIRVWQENGTAGLSVSDQGIGIPHADLPHVFERFHRGANVDDRRFAGMGLGLFICHGIVEQHGGRIWVESEPGRGSTFQVRLPLAG